MVMRRILIKLLLPILFAKVDSYSFKPPLHFDLVLLPELASIIICLQTLLHTRGSENRIGIGTAGIKSVQAFCGNGSPAISIFSVFASPKPIFLAILMMG